MANKRDDFARFTGNLSADLWAQFCGQLRDYLADVFRSLQSVEKVKNRKKSV
jgi:hypothetical protein